jgi:hypothetical protein
MAQTASERRKAERRERPIRTGERRAALLDGAEKTTRSGSDRRDKDRRTGNDRRKAKK